MQNVVPMMNFVKALQNENGIDNDLTTLSKWVREELFFVLIHDLKSENDQTMSEDGPLCSMFVKRFMKRENRSLIVNADIQEASDEEMTGYLKHLWTKGISKEAKGKGNIRKNLSLEKTAVYAAINDAFKSKFQCSSVPAFWGLGFDDYLVWVNVLSHQSLTALMIDCIVHDVPFPAYETFDDRQNLSRRFYLFFDRFFKAGRHNKGLWNAALERNKGSNNISFGTCIFEAHVKTTIQENYFAWMYQALASPRIIQVLERADDFKTEYDFDELPNELACGCAFISELPLSCEIRYNTTTNVFETISSLSQMHVLRVEQKKHLQEIIDRNKGERRETLKTLRQMIDAVRPRYLNYNKEEKKAFNMEAKRTLWTRKMQRRALHLQPRSTSDIPHRISVGFLVKSLMCSKR